MKICRHSESTDAPLASPTSRRELLQLAAAAASVPLLRQVVDEARAGGGDASPARGGLRPRCEPWIVLRGRRIEDDVADAVSDHLDTPIVATVGDDLRVVSDATSGVAPGSRGRGPGSPNL